MHNMTIRPLTVVLLSFDFVEYCLRLGDALSHHATVILLLPEQQVGPHRELLKNVHCDVQLFHKPRLRQPRSQVAMIATLMRTIRVSKPDILHIQQGHAWFNAALPLLAEFPLVMTVHDPKHHVGDREGQKHPQVLYDFGFRRASHVIVHSRDNKREVVDRLQYPVENIHVIPHIRLGNDSPPSEEMADNPVVLFFGRIWEYKGLAYLIRAEPLITSAVPNARIVIAGQGEDFDRYRRMMVNPQHFTILNEYVSHDTRTELFREAAVVVLPYIDASQSGVIPLAYSCAKPVVATTVGGLPEIVEHGRTGYLVPPRDENALAAAVVNLLQNPARAREFGRNGQQKLRAECSQEIIAEQTLAAYDITLSRRAVQVLGKAIDP